MEWGRQMGFVNHYYFYIWDPEWGPTFWKTNAYAPWPICTAPGMVESVELGKESGSMAAPRKYPEEVKERAVRMVRDIDERGAIKRVADQLDIHPETLRNWTRQAEIDDGSRAGTTTEQAEENKRLRAENAELRRANEILKAASSFFARELDRPQRR